MKELLLKVFAANQQKLVKDMSEMVDNSQLARCSHPYYCFSCKNEWDANEWCGNCPECGSDNISYLIRKQ